MLSIVGSKFSSSGSSVGAKSSTQCVDYDGPAKEDIYRGSNAPSQTVMSTATTSCCNISYSDQKPHKADCLRWEAIKAVRSRDGFLDLNHFKKLQNIGSGNAGTVFLSELRGTNCYFAVKVIDRENLASRNKLHRLHNEREIMELLDHPFLPTLYGHFETQKFSYFVMEYCPGGDLYTLRQRQPGGRFSEEAARFYAAEVLLALEYLHALGVVYRDLKPENVLIREDGHVMLSDFDLSKRLAVYPALIKSSPYPLRRYFIQPETSDESFREAICGKSTCAKPSCLIPLLLPRKSKKAEKASKNNVYKREFVAEPSDDECMSFVGTQEYLAPEIITEMGHGSAVDWWTFGIFLYELLYGKTPFKGSAYDRTLHKVVVDALTFPEAPSATYEAKDLIRGLLVKDPKKRLASKRGSAEIKEHPFFEGINWPLVRYYMRPPQVPELFQISSQSSATTPEESW